MSPDLNIFSNPSVVQSAGFSDCSHPTIPKRKPIPSSQTYERAPQTTNTDYRELEEHENVFPQKAKKSKSLKFLGVLFEALITILPVAFIGICLGSLANV
jgi:hypothetical protein